MNHKILQFIGIFLLSLTVNTAQAQSDTQEMLRRRAAEKVSQMNDYISNMGNKKKNKEVREYYRTKALNLFIAGGKEYEENGIQREGVVMETTSTRRNTVTRTLMSKYFTNLINLRYSDVSITSTDVANIKVSNLRRVGNGVYVCTCQFDQAFVGYRDGIPVYKDITTKRVKCYVVEEDTEDGKEYIILLGDVSAVETRKG